MSGKREPESRLWLAQLKRPQAGFSNRTSAAGNFAQ
jgi:hypothetical protein